MESENKKVSPEFGSLDELEKLSLKIGQITNAEDILGSDKLLKLTVDFGSETQTILSGVKAHYKPEELIGLSVPFVTNIPPRKMMGLQSNGMILAAKDEEKLTLLVPHRPISPGAHLG